ncbi:MAG: RNA-binding protein [Candidatus Woesebacteria bacterium]|nr:MAG: RNA-binding protein [Candidatus Woesebacteria bacterium]
MQNSKLFIGNLDFTVVAEDLKALFADAGTVTDAAVITDKMTGRSRGFGFITMSTEEEAKAAIEKFNQFDLKGRKINVNLARPMEPRQ